MTRLLVAYAVVLAVLCAGVASFVAGGTPPRPIVLASVWREGQLVIRERVDAVGASTSALDSARAEGGEIVYTTVEREAPLFTRPEALLALSLVPGRDGLAVTLDGRTVYVTPDDLVARAIYDRGIALDSIGFTAGVDVPALTALVAERLETSPVGLFARASARRIRVARVAPSVTGDSLSAAEVRDAAMAAARHLARGVDGDGRFRYLVDAPTNRDLPGYDWPRHAGATYFLAQAAALSDDGDVRYATLRAAARLRDLGLAECGEHRCVAQEGLAEIGSSALAVIAFVEIVRTELDASYRPAVHALAAFLRSQQREDGELMHQYDRAGRRPVDVQYPYFSGEAALALARAHTLDGDPRDEEAARRSIAHLVGPAWRFFGDRYYFGEEHWTCQAMAELWRSAPDPNAFDFCLRWQRFGRRLQHVAGDSPYDSDGAVGIDPVLTPRVTPVASRAEAAVATLDVVLHGGVHVGGAERRALEAQIRRALAFVVRHQLRPGPSHLFAEPAAVEGAIPGSVVDLQLRIDYAQHAGSAMIRWLEVTGSGPKEEPPPPAKATGAR